MSISSVKKVVKEGLKKTSPSGTQVSGAEAEAIVAEAKKNGVTTGERQVVADVYETADLSPAAKSTLGDFLRPAPTDITLGFLPKPGAALSGKTFTLAPEQSLVFEADGNQITNMGELKAPGLTVTQQTLHMPDSEGGMTRSRYTVTMPASSRAGVSFTATSSPAWQSRGNPTYDFAFTIKAGDRN